MRFQDAFFLHRAAYDGLRASRLRMQKLSKYAKLCYRRLISVGCGVHIKDVHDRQSDDFNDDTAALVQTGNLPRGPHFTNLALCELFLISIVVGSIIVRR